MSAELKHDFTPEFSKLFSQVRNKYDKLGLNLTQAIESFLKEIDINYLSISYRIKDKASFLEKIERKNYTDPFEQVEDICGIRIICYYQSDVELIEKILLREFDVLENQDKESLLQDDQFGYRSTHYIVKIKSNWLQAPNYRGLENIKAEIQIRTILMHAWAEIEHKLAYKKEIHIPKQFKRKLHRISAKLEEADEQFEELRDAVTKYREDIIVKTNDDLHTEEKIELNLDSLQAFLDDKFPDRIKSIEGTRGLVDEFTKYNITLTDLIKSYEKIKDFLPEIEKDAYNKTTNGNRKWAQVGIARKIMDFGNKEYCEKRDVPQYVKDIVEKWRKIIDAKGK